MSKIEIKRINGKEFYFTVKAGNNKEILNSNPFHTLDALKEAIPVIRANIGNDSKYEMKGEDGKFTFVFDGVLKSKVYASELSRKNGIKSVKKNILDAEAVTINPIILPQ